MNFIKGVAEYLTPVLKESQFLAKGVLTPEEFVQAGDQLTFKCPTWQWSPGDPDSKKPYLPDDKQILVTRNVPCRRRVRDLESAYKAETEVTLDDGDAKDEDGGWLATHTTPEGIDEPEAKDDDMVISAEVDNTGTASLLQGLTIVEDHMDREASRTDEVTVVSGAGAGAGVGTGAGVGVGAGAGGAATGPVEATAGAGATVPSAGSEASDSDDDYADMATFEEDNLVEDPAKAVPTQSAPAPYLRAVEPDDNILRTRTYDITITYDKYYQTPRVFLFGYNEMRKPLSSEEVFQDIMQDYANKTVTFEPHPHQPAAGLHAAIHPCRHAETMKRIIDHVASSGQDVRVDQYLFIFLKFIQSVIPTVNYDYTMGMTAK